MLRVPPPLGPFGLVLHHDGRWTHEGLPILNTRLRAAFDRGVQFLPDEGDTGKYVVRLGHFRGEIEVEEAGFFVRSFDVEAGLLALSDGTTEALDPASLRVSPRDGALVCTVKRNLIPIGVPARFLHSAQALFLDAVEDAPDGPAVRVGGRLHPVPELD